MNIKFTKSERQKNPLYVQIHIYPFNNKYQEWHDLSLDLEHTIQVWGRGWKG